MPGTLHGAPRHPSWVRLPRPLETTSAVRQLLALQRPMRLMEITSSVQHPARLLPARHMEITSSSRFMRPIWGETRLNLNYDDDDDDEMSVRPGMFRYKEVMERLGAMVQEHGEPFSPQEVQRQYDVEQVATHLVAKERR